ncbi:TSUP family transporter [Roseovarius sp. SYSU LYC5161]|uniref:TSUP family transporter n=1 Tax=Roseovarius halophilus (ex Wu et al. 2025) TaxID=3376060 RepID=UPI002871DA07|nr:TSUP family transporter [Roseovarius sp.]
MPDTLVSALATPGLFWLMATICVAGVVRGFTGFGTALIFVPVAGIFLPAERVIALIGLTGIASTAALLPGAWARAAHREVGLLAVAALFTVPVGLLILDVLPGAMIRWIVAAIATATLAALIAGWRFSGRVSRTGLAGIGGVAGVVGGLTGLTGPVVILFYLAGQSAALSVRANTILFLAILDVVVVANLVLRGSVTIDVVVVAALLAVPYFVTTLVGQSLFDPRHERLYRWAAYAVIALAVASGLPIWQMGE